MKLNLTTDVEMILRTGNYLYDGIMYGFKKGRALSKAPKYDNSEFLKRKYTGAEKTLLQNFMVECFTVAGVLNYDLQERLKKSAEEILKREDETDPKKLFMEEAKKIIPQYQYDGNIPPEGHLKTNFRTAVTSAYHGSMWTKIQEAGIYSALQYKTRKDSKVRPEHRSLDDKIFYTDDEIWNTIYPPNGHNCRCYTTPLTVSELVGQTVESPVRSKDDTKKLIKEAGISKDFNRNSGITLSIWNKWLDAELKEKNIDRIYDDMKSYAKDKMPAEESIVKDSLKQSPKLFEVSNEVWGYRYKSGEVYKTEIIFIKIFTDKFQVMKSVDGNLSELKEYSLDKIDVFRKGVLIKIKS